MGRALWIPDFVRDYGLEPVEIAGWQGRGDDYFDPWILLNHHTAGAANGWMPSLGILINGRAGLPGPLAQVGLARDGRVPVIASGRANHAGKGSWLGIVGNSSSMGVEAESTGTGDWTSSQRTNYPILNAALLDGMNKNSSHCCGHKEYAPRRKIDPVGIDMDDQRFWTGVAQYGHAIGPIDLFEEEDMSKMVTAVHPNKKRGFTQLNRVTGEAYNWNWPWDPNNAKHRPPYIGGLNLAHLKMPKGIKISEAWYDKDGNLWIVLDNHEVRVLHADGRNLKP